MDSLSHCISLLFILLILSFTIIHSSALSPTSGEDDATPLLALKVAFDPHSTSHLNWTNTTASVCEWEGVKSCLRGRVSKLVIENLNLTAGKLDGKSLNALDQLRVLSFKGNNLGGEIPDLSGLVNLKVVYLNSNAFTGGFPKGLVGLHRLKIIVLSNNHLTGEIPPDLTSIARLYILYLDGNKFGGEIPPLNQSELTFLNLSRNRLSGQIPATVALAKFNASVFGGNVGLCGPQVMVPCKGNTSVSSKERGRKSSGKKKKRKRKIIIIAVSAAAGAFVLLLLVILLLAGISNKRRRKKVTNGERGKKDDEVEAAATTTSGGGGNRGARERGEPSSGNNGGKGGVGVGGFSWEGEGLGKLVFIGVEAPAAGEDELAGRYSLEELLKASAETLGKGTVGSTYKAVMESGFIVTVKRLKESRYPRVDEFRRQMEVLGRMRHPNVVAVRAYFQAKEERLLVYDYFPNGSLFSLIHGSRATAAGGRGGGKPLHWTSCLKIAEDVATGLLYIHQNLGLVHGNLKSSNVLLGSDFESCLTDYNLHPFRNPEAAESSSSEPPSATSLFYRAPECRVTNPSSSSSSSSIKLQQPTQQADVYSFGVLLLELLTGKTPFMDLVQEHGADIPKWVKSIREEETTDHSDPSGSSGNENNNNNISSEEKLNALLTIAMACVSVLPENRPHIREVLRMIREARAEGGNNNLSSANSSSGHSPGRWSDTVQSLPREDEQHQSI